MKTKAKPKSIVATIEAFVNYAENDKDVLKEFCKVIDAYFNELAADDYFGTEGQCDPRGDGRDC